MGIKRELDKMAMFGLASVMLPQDQVKAVLKKQPTFNSKTSKSIEYQPTGTKEYFFNAQAEFSTTKMAKEDIIFKCYAINDKNAKRKFDKFKKTIL